MMKLTLQQFMALPEETREEQRRAAKAVNFGLLYGMKPPGLVDYARKSYGVLMSLDDAEDYWDTFFRTYKLIPYHDRVKESAHKHLMVRNPLGRVRHLPLINSYSNKVRSLSERQAVNSTTQSCLSDMMLLAMVEIDRRWPHIHIFGMTHDSLEMYLDLDGVEDQLREIRDVLQNLPLHEFDWEPEISFVADAEIALEGSLADVKKITLM
jgi:DNA polymerase-1